MQIWQVLVSLGIALAAGLVGCGIAAWLCCNGWIGGDNPWSKRRS